MKKQKVKLLLLILFLFYPICSNSCFVSDNNFNRISWVTPTIDDSIDFDYLASKIAEKETVNMNWKKVNKIGCMGLYQFKESTLKELGYNVNLEEFRINPNVFPIEMQHKAFKDYLKYNYKLLKKYIEKYASKEIHGRTLSANQILAAAHFAGAGGVKHYFNTGKISHDCINHAMTIITYTNNI